MNEKSGCTALVFAGGGSLGAVQVGMLHELVVSGLTFDLIVGASVGALNAAYFSRSPTLETVDGLESLWRAVKRADILPINLATLWRVAVNHDSLTDGQALR
jgi:NTE family protein